MRETTRLFQISYTDRQFRDVLNLREAAYERREAGVSDEIDRHSLHFVAIKFNTIIGALRVTCRQHGPLESENHYPEWLLRDFGGVMAAASRLCIARDFQAVSQLPMELTKFAWQTVLPMGIRLDLTKARLHAIPYYLRLGYLLVRDSLFQFERWDETCALIAFPAKAREGCRLSSIFEGIENPCDLHSSGHIDRFTSSYRDYVAMSRSHLIGAES